MSIPELVVYGVVTFGTSILSGIAGGGAGFINAPLLIFFGLSPAEAVATGKLTGLSVALSSLSGLRKTPTRQSKKELGIIVLLALLVGLLAPLAITALNGQLYRRILGVIMLAMIPLLLTRKSNRVTAHPSPTRRAVGYIILLPVLLLQGVFGAGTGALVNIALMTCMGLSGLESSIAKRYSQVVLNIVIVLGLLGSHLIIWCAAVVGMATSALGAYFGTHLAIHGGERLITIALLVLCLASALFLLFGA